MPKCKKCGLEVTQNKAGVWVHVDKGHLTHSAEPVSLNVAYGANKKSVVFIPPVRPPLFGDSKKCGGGKRKSKKFNVTKYLEAKTGKRGRLPDRSDFHIIYNASTKTWSGTLTVPGVGIFSGVELGAFLLLNSLDLKYRDAAAKVGSKAGK